MQKFDFSEWVFHGKEDVTDVSIRFLQEEAANVAVLEFIDNIGIGADFGYTTDDRTGDAEVIIDLHCSIEDFEDFRMVFSLADHIEEHVSGVGPEDAKEFVDGLRRIVDKLENKYVIKG